MISITVRIQKIVIATEPLRKCSAFLLLKSLQEDFRNVEPKVAKQQGLLCDWKTSQNYMRVCACECVCASVCVRVCA